MKAISFLFAINSLLIVFCQTPLVNLFKNSNKLLIAGIGSFLIGTGMSILGFSFTFALAIFSCIVYTAGEMIFFPLTQLICYENGPDNKKGLCLGMFRMTYAASKVLGPIIGGIIYSRWGGNMIWSLSGCIGIICLTAYIYCQRYLLK
jgi:MFS family permease